MARSRDIHNVEIVKVADKGLGMGYHDGKVIFVERSVPGDIVDVRTFKSKKNFAMAYPLNFVKLSEQRIEPFCTHFGVCGGCKWQNLPYDVQLLHKSQLVADALQRITGMKGTSVQKIIGAEPDRYYRNKLEFTFSNRKWLKLEELESAEEFQRDGLGFHIPRQFDKVLDLSECHLQPQPSNAIRMFVRAYALRHGISFFDLRSQEGIMRNLIVRNNIKGEFLVILAVREEFSQMADMLNTLNETFPEIVSVFYVINAKGNSSINDLDVVHFSGVDHLVESLGEVHYRIGPKSFFQTNTRQAKVLYDLVRKHADLQPDDLVYDLYTGLGSIALYIANQCKEVVGIEWIEDAVTDARVNAELNDIKNCSFYSGDMAKMLTGEFVEKNGVPDVIITDPPRAGMHDKVNRVIAESGARKIVYVSCNPVTQARDLQVLLEQYDLDLLQPVDMFPHTWHIENIAVLSKKITG